MPVPDFSPGEVLTAAAMDSIGLWLVKTQTIGTAVSSVIVTDAFSADYDNYEIIVTGADCTAAPTARLTFGSIVANYYGSMYYDIYSGTDNGIIRIGNGASLPLAVMGDSGDTYIKMTIYNPYKTLKTGMTASYHGTGYSGFSGGQTTNSSSVTSFTITASTGTFTGGIVRVYGYRN